MKKTNIQEALIEAMDLKVGDTVRITHKVPSYSLNWEDVWIKEMDKYIGEEYTVISIYKAEMGIQLGIGYQFPAHCLEKVERKIEFRLNSDYTAVLTKDKVTVGCQEFHIDTIKKLVNTYNNEFK
jgi:hypothetical protein